MFEAITESQPDDYQSLEILKEAYNKLGRQPDSLRVSARLAEVYAKFGEISQAILEYEGILQECPDDAKIRTALSELQQKVVTPRTTPQSEAPSLAGDSKPTAPAGAPAGAPSSRTGYGDDGDGDRALAEVLIAEKLVTKQAIQPLLQRLKANGGISVEKGDPLTLVQLLVDEQIAKMEDLLVKLVERSGLPYLPLSVYDVDHDSVCQLPAEFCFAHCVAPFDLMSRSALVATANPFDARVREEAQRLLNCNVFWFVAAPAEIIAALRRVHRPDAKAGNNVFAGAPS
jgi:tetratricopeptide (TPR) repeat protein